MRGAVVVAFYFGHSVYKFGNLVSEQVSQFCDRYVAPFILSADFVSQVGFNEFVQATVEHG